ncbi:hypothetical protein [Longispora albida]|uniref:hypothetical protein n=1 Tax=Longispora albida TaxID=203523 RepID=UPI0003789799|nr:hypothetical protein [Longispora albida]
MRDHERVRAVHDARTALVVAVLAALAIEHGDDRLDTWADDVEKSQAAVYLAAAELTYAIQDAPTMQPQGWRISDAHRRLLAERYLRSRR